MSIGKGVSVERRSAVVPGVRVLRQLCLLFAVGVVAVPDVASAQAVACKPTVTGRVDTFPLASDIFHNTRMLRVWLPPGFDPLRKYPVLYILDGASAFDACTAFKHEEMRADETLTELIASGRIPPIIAVGVDNGSDATGNVDDGALRAREFLPFADPTYPKSLVPLGAAFPTFLEKEVMPAIAARYPVGIGPDHTALWGASYGGVAALYVLLGRPDLFGAGIVESPALQVGNGQLLRDTTSLVIAPARLAIGVGTAEVTDVPDATAVNKQIVRAVQQLVQNLKAAFVSGRVQLTVTPNGRHDTPTFGRRFQAGLLFLYGPQ